MTQGPPSQILSSGAYRAAQVFTGVTIPLLFFALVTLVIRLAFKLRLKGRIDWDDGLLAFGTVLAIVEWGMLMANIAWALTPLRFNIPPELITRILKVGIISATFWVISITFIKLGVAVMLLRFQERKPWRLALYATISILIAFCISNTLFILMQCMPLQAAWDVSIKDKTCVGYSSIRIASNVGSAINIVTDMFLSVFPLSFLTRLSRPKMEKILISILMAVGITATVASMAKTIKVNQWVNTSDPMHVSFIISILTAVELFLGIIAACLPCLKSTIERGLRRIGIDSGFGNAEAEFSREISLSKTSE